MFQYDSAIPTDKDQVRFLIQDTADTGHKFEDEEITFVLGQEANAYMAAAQLCDILVARAGGVSRKRIGDLSIQYDPMFYRTLSGNLRARGCSYQIPYAGGISVADKQLQQNDASATTPSIVRGIDENAAAPQPEVPPINPLQTQ